MTQAVLPLLRKLPPGTYRACGCGRAGGDDGLCPDDCRDPRASKPFRLQRRVTRVWLCRCGHSRTTPFCDGSHNRAPGD